MVTSNEIRNICLIGHSGSGKTSLVEAILFQTGVIKRLGKVDDDSSTSDYDPEEIKRKISINLTLAPCEDKKYKINLLDTPGYSDFIAEVKSGLKVSECALMAVSAVSGVEVGTENTWEFADEFNLPRLVFINKMDKENADFFQTFNSLVQSFGQSLLPIQLPLGKEADFKGVIDLIKLKAFVYSEDGKFNQEDIPEENKAPVDKFREKLIEVIAETDDDLLTKYLEGEELTEVEIQTGLKNGVISRKITPILCGSALKNIAIHPLLDYIESACPSPFDQPALEIADLKNDKAETIEIKESDPLSALVFKAMADPYIGKLTYFRVYTGTFKSDSQVYNATKGRDERVGQLFYLCGKQQTPTSEVIAGDIGVTTKLQITTTSDTLCQKSRPIIIKPVNFPKPIISLAVEPKSKKDEDKLSTSLNKLTEDDPTLNIQRDNEIKQTLISGVGETQLNIAVERLKEKFGIDISTEMPRLPYKETITKSAKAQGKYKRQTGGRGQYGDCWLQIEPLPRGEGYEFKNKIFGGAIPSNYVPAVGKGVLDAIKEGVVARYPVIDVKVTLYDGTFHPVDSSDIAFKIAGSMAFKNCAEQAAPVLLEPIMKVTIEVSETFTGDIIGDLNSKRGKILGTQSKDKKQVINALVPLAEMFRYAIDLKSITGGRGYFSMEFSHYEEVPPQISQKIIKARGEEK